MTTVAVAAVLLAVIALLTLHGFLLGIVLGVLGVVIVGIAIYTAYVLWALHQL